MRADHEHEPELFWALRGGGGNFGVVTALELELYPVPELYAGMLAWPWERTADVLHAWREWVPGLPDEMGTWARILQVPPLPDIPEPVRGRQLVVVEVAYLGGEDAGGELLAAAARARPGTRHVSRRPRRQRSAISTWTPRIPCPSPRAASSSTSSRRPLSTPIVEAAGPGSGSPLLSLELRLLGGALTQAAPDAGALATLDHAVLTFAVGMVMDPEMGAAVNATDGGRARALERWDAGVKFANFVDVPMDARTCYPPETFDRLQQVKARYDPDDLFRANHPIPSVAAAE